MACSERIEDTNIGGHQGLDRLIAIQFRPVVQCSPNLPETRFDKPSSTRRGFPADECLFNQFIDADLRLTGKGVLAANDHHQLIGAQIIHNEAGRDRLRYHDTQVATSFDYRQLDVGRTEYFQAHGNVRMIRKEFF